MSDTFHVVVAGCGPAGAAAAQSLHRLGFKVTVINTPRGFVACEGVSARVVGALQQLGFERALATLAPPSQRTAEWNGERDQANWEQLVRRDQLDAALIQDLESAGISMIAGRVRQLRESDCDVTIHYQPVTDSSTKDVFELQADFFVDARGRSAPGASQERMRGPETLGLLQYWQGEPGQARSEVASFEHGWIWLAQFYDGSRYTQLSLNADKIPPRDQLPAYFQEILSQQPAAQSYMENAQPRGELTARSATAMLAAEPIAGRCIRIGDAAMTVDPLSGNGIFQALSTGLIAPAIITTLLKRPQNAELARQFYRERVHHAFMRFARLGRDFYQQEQRWSEKPFWRLRQRWPDSVPMHEPPRREGILVEQRPVVCDHFIELKEVVITPDQPLGIWHFNGLPLAPLVKTLLASPQTRLTRDWFERMGVADVSQQQGLTQWLLQQGVITQL